MSAAHHCIPDATDTPATAHPACRGFTLVELMVAMVAGMLLLGAVAKFFVISRHTFEQLQTVTTLQETVGMLTFLMTTQARTAHQVVWDADTRTLSFPDHHPPECTRFFIGANRAFSCDANHNQALIGGADTGVRFNPDGFSVACIPDCDTTRPLGLEFRFGFDVEGIPEAQTLRFTVALRNNIMIANGDEH